MANPFSLEGKNAWITGASYGIGFNIAKAFVEAGAKTIIFNDINEAALERGLANYKEAGITNVKGYVCDVTDEEGVKALVEKIHEEVGQIDILVNNAGIIKRIPMHEMKRAEFQQVIDIDLVAPYICAAAVLPEMMERKEGKIINICSMMSELGKDSFRLCGSKGRSEDAHTQHLLRVRRVQHPVQRHRSGLYRHSADSSSPRASGRRLTPSVRLIHLRKDSCRTLA